MFLGAGARWWGWMADIQFLPSLLSLNIGVIAVTLAVTLLLGRIYCSVICPLGILQDVSLNLRQRLGRAKVRRQAKSGAKPDRTAVKRFSFSPERKWLRYGVLALSVAAYLAGAQVAIALIAPYSSYGRIVRSFIELGRPGGSAILIAAGLLCFVLITGLSAAWGRTWCNNICPVGSVLSLLSRVSLYKPVIDSSRCTGCHSCEKGCKASCIDSDTRTIDASRCIDCFDCLDNCKSGAISFSPSWGGRKSSSSETDGKGRRAFISTMAVLTAGGLAKAQDIKTDGGLAPVQPKVNPERETRLVPFGAGSEANFYSRCTACQLCVSSCPSHVLRPSTDIRHLLQPQMVFTDGHCRPECTVCADVCPAGAILPLKAEEKLSIRIGVAKVNLDLCLVGKDDIDCGNCARHCPVGAIRMVQKDGHHIPVVMEDRCIGCGACEHLCPSRPLSAITVNGYSTHIR